MIAKAKSIAHGSISIDYITRLGEAEIIALNHLPSEVEPSAWYYHMMLHQQLSHCLACGRPLKNSIIRIEISPSREESVNFTQIDWEQLVIDTLKAMDAINLSRKGGRKTVGRTNLSNSQYIATLHRDSKSGILHLHIDINRVDMDGNSNDDSFIGKRAVMAANEVARQRGWSQAAAKSAQNKQNITMVCYNVLRNMRSFSWVAYQSALESKGYDVQLKRDSKNEVRGYSIRMGNSIYKSSVLGKGRNLTPSKIEATWRRMKKEVGKTSISTLKQRTTGESGQHSVMTPQNRRMARPVEPQMTHRTIDIDDHNYEIDVPNKAMSAMKEEIASYQEPAETSERIADVALLLFANYIEAATSVAESGGGGSGSPAADWGRKRDEDEENWWRRCAWTAYQMVTTPKFKRGRGR
jgi:hypothetical protein